jgi:S1-C subfamily serine protease
MPRLLAVVAFLAAISTPAASADDSLTPEVVAAVKRATVYIKVKGPSGMASGSGFVISSEKDSVLVATNHHVISPLAPGRKDLPHSEVVRNFKVVNVTVVFDPGNPSEREVRATILTADANHDLAVLRVSGLKDPPTPIEYMDPPTLTETMPVYSFGFPFGQTLATSKGAPAVTVGKAAISSLRKNDRGELDVIQINGSLNPGNSGGPIVDTTGRLVGVAVAKLRNGEGIGFAVPGIELVRMMKGRLGDINLVTTQGFGGKWTVRAEVGVIDPMHAVRNVNLHYQFVGPGARKPSAKEPLSQQPAAKKLTLKIVGGVATGDVSLDTINGDLFVQAIPEGGVGEPTLMQKFGLSSTRPAGPVAANPPNDFMPPPDQDQGGPADGPPAGWKEYVPQNQAYSIWIPDRAKSQRQAERTTTTHGLQLKFNILLVEMPTGLSYVVEEVLLPPGVANGKRAELEDLIKEIATSATQGRLAGEFAVKMGTIPGKEFRIEVGQGLIRVRVFVAGDRLLVLRVIGSKLEVDGPAGNIFLTSCRAPTGSRPGVGPQPGPPPALPGLPTLPGQPGVGIQPGAGLNPQAGPRPAPNRMTKIQGGFNDPEFFEESPNEGLLVGMEVGIGRFFDSPVVHAVRPIFRTGAVDTVGQWHGPTVGKEMQRIVAKPGYAVGAITVKNGLTIDGVLITFMRVTPTGLDPGDSYDSPWIGGMGGGPPVKLGDGLAVVGLIGKVKADSVTGLGLLYREQVIVDAPANPPARPEPEPTPTIPATPQVIPAPPPLSPAPPPTKPKTDTLPRQALESPKQAIVDSNSGAEPSDKSSRTTLGVRHVIIHRP